YKMGDDGSTRKAERPAHGVWVPGFFLGKYEITQAQWLFLMGNNPSFFPGCGKCPEDNVNWYMANDFVKELSRKTGLKFRLPTEAEWEFAARGGIKSQGFIYSGSNDPNTVAWYQDVGNNRTHEIGQLRANELGIFDMSGNVFEWCQDWFSDSAYSTIDYDRFPAGPPTGMLRVMRGGWGGGNVPGCLVTTRFSVEPGTMEPYIGFRIALSP
ncbi:MAG: hypothetical protein RLZZ519_1717, partial [Bacteroidota bacterium]